jgi:hypothetical protein
MSRFIATLVVLAALVVGIGYYLNWFTISKTDDNQKSSTDISVHIDKGKVKADAEKAKEKAKEMEQKIEHEFEKK